MFGASSELASVMEFGFNLTFNSNYKLDGSITYILPGNLKDIFSHSPMRNILDFIKKCQLI